MKKILSLVLVLSLLVLSVFALASCKQEPEEKDYQLAIGVAVTQSGAKVSKTAAAIVIDKDGKIVLCRIDAVDFTAKLNDGELNTAAPATKAEQGDNYGMLSSYGSSLAEWDDQAKFFESKVVGKTQAEVAAIKTKDADLVAGCTIDVTDFVKAIDNAFKSAYKTAFKASGTLTAGIALNNTVKGNEPLTTATFTSDFAATVMADGKVVAAVLDATEVKLPVTVEEDAIEAGTMSYPGTKLEQGDNYNMVAYGKAQAEWYAQAGAYAATAVGKTASELNSLATDNVAGCTMKTSMPGFKATLIEAASYVR